jgi:membrane protein
MPSARRWTTTLAAVRRQWVRDDMGTVAGALTFFALLALFPFLMFLVALFGWLLDARETEALVQSVSEVLPAAVAEILGARIRALATTKSAGLVTGSGLGAWVSASGGMLSLASALNTAYGVRETRSYLRRRLVALGMTLFTAAVTLVAGLAAVALPSLAGLLAPRWGGLLVWVRLPVAGGLMALLWAALDYALPDTRRRFRPFSPGAVAGVLVWVAASWGFSLYVTHFGRYEVTYGALGGFVVLLMWMWLSSQALLLGAEIDAALAGRRLAPPPAAPPPRARAPGRPAPGPSAPRPGAGASTS